VCKINHQVITNLLRDDSGDVNAPVPSATNFSAAAGPM